MALGALIGCCRTAWPFWQRQHCAAGASQLCFVACYASLGVFFGIASPGLVRDEELQKGARVQLSCHIVSALLALCACCIMVASWRVGRPCLALAGPACYAGVLLQQARAGKAVPVCKSSVMCCSLDCACVTACDLVCCGCVQQSSRGGGRRRRVG
jgi:hypothetical protein